MPTTYTNGLKLPDLGSIDWFNAYKNNIDILDPIVGTVNGVATTYAPISHNHDASEITSGTIDIARLPPAALERLTTVADQTARYALTTSTVQLGDTVKQLDTGIMYLVVDTTKLNSADGYVEYSAGTASKAIADEDGTSIKTGYVNVAGNQTVSGQKTWTGSNTFQTTARLKNTVIEKGNKPSTPQTEAVEFVDKNNTSMGYIRYLNSTDGSSALEFRIDNLYKDGQVDPTGTSNYTYFSLALGGDGQRLSVLASNLRPFHNSAYSLGSSSYQWSSVYAQTYYYNGTAWGLDQNNTWTGSNTFQTTDIYYSAVEPRYVFKSLGLERGVQPSWHGTATCYWYDKNSAELGFTRFVLYNNGMQTYEIGLQNKATNGDLSPTGSTISTSFQLKLFRTGDSQLTISADALVPAITNSHDLGTSTNKWKTLNGINPGALSLPDLNNTVDITSTFNSAIDKTQNLNSYTADFTGWLFVIWWTEGLTAPYYIYFYCTNSASDSDLRHSVWGQTFGMPSSAYFIHTVIPVISGKTYWIETSFTRASTDTKNLAYSVRKLPNLGNV